ncbi:hypothetical protein FOA43_000746 [Brettanomyces nanus]|uniref:Uncharacterized protein n=1 Tax=Eeniella nana TaxID=13502 RepID=A0A875RWW4_EENNA|nr:uncharacterized protein FOA43_000746 [Brettanomyces nanus]QPG73436.1 hypothetical protein FOA43_000746 [Brettanomyces nanus]
MLLDGSKTIRYLLQFYRERLSIEEEYARKLNNLARKSNIGTKERAGSTLRDSLAMLVEETKQLSNSHSSEAQKIADLVYQPLNEFLSNLKASNKPWESTIVEFVRYKESLKLKTRQAGKKYESSWSKINGLRTEQILLDDTEARNVQKKIDKLAAVMIEEREKFYKLVTQYNQVQESFKKEWCKYCENSQSLEEERIKTIRRNIWEYANTISSSCIQDDQSAENIRLSLEKCSFERDIDEFVNSMGTGDRTGVPMKFVDFAKGESKKSNSAGVEDEGCPVDVDALLASRRKDRMLRSKEKLLKSYVNKKVPPDLTERQQTTLELVDRSSKTFKELEKQAEKETIAKAPSEQGSEPSTYKVMSEYSGTTAYTSDRSSSISAAKMKSKLEDNVFSNPLLNSRSSAGSAYSRKLKNVDSNEVLRDSPDPLRAYLDDLSLGGNGDMKRFEQSIMPRSEIMPTRKNLPESQRSQKGKSMGFLLKNDMKSSPMTEKQENQIPHPDLQSIGLEEKPSAVNIHRLQKIEDGPSNLSSRITSVTSQGHRVPSMRRAKSQENLNFKFITSEDLPSHSSEGFPVLKYCRAQFDYSPEIDQELTFKKKDILMILHQQPDGWWFAENINTGDSGLAPSNYLTDL